MPQRCSFGCKNNGVHSFPSEKKIRKQWEVEIAMRRKNFKISKHSKLCSAHFRADDYVQESFYTGLPISRRQLKRGVIPTVWCKKEVSIDKQNASIDIPKGLAQIKVENCENIILHDDSNYGAESGVIKIEHIEENTSNVVPELFDPLICSTREIGTQKYFVFFTIERFKNDNKAILFYTGMESFAKFQFVYNTLCPKGHSLKYRSSQEVHISSQDQFFLTLIKLRRNTDDYELGIFFDVSPTLASDIFVTWIHFMYQVWSKSSHSSQAICNSDKSKPTLKLGTVESSRVAGVYSGSNDRQIINDSECLKADSTLTDHDFKIYGDRKTKEIPVTIPFVRDKNQLLGLTVIEDRKLETKHIHIERLTDLTDTYQFLQIPVSNKHLSLMSELYFVCQRLHKFKKDTESQNSR